MRARHIAVGVVISAALITMAVWWWGSVDRGPGFVERDSQRRVSRTALSFHGLASNEVPKDPGASWLVEPGVQPRRIAGMVLADGKPFAGATVELRSEFARLGGAKPPTVISDQEGRFDFGPQLPTIYAVVVSTSSHQTEIVGTNLRNPTHAPGELVIELRACRSWIYGEVTDLHGSSIGEGSVVVASKISQRSWFEELYEVAIERDGSFSLCRPPEGRQLWVKAPGYGTAWLRDSMPPGGYQVQLFPACQIQGRVVDAHGVPIAGARVVAMGGMSSGASPVGMTTVSHTDGSFAFADLSPGRFELAADHGSYYSDFSTLPVAVVEPNAAPEEVLLVMKPLRRLSGVVLQGDHPVVGQKVGPHLEAITQEDGSFVITGAVFEELTMKVDRFEVHDPRVPAGEEDLDDLVVRVRSLAVVLGRVTAQGAPVAGAIVSVPSPPDALGFPVGPGTTSRTDAEGRYWLIGLPDGTCELDARDPKTGRRSRPQSIDVRRDRRNILDLRLDVGASIRGLLVDASGQAIANLELHLSGGLTPSASDPTQPFYARALVTTTDVDGAFHFRGLSAGRYELCIGWCFDGESDPRYGPLEADTWPAIDVPKDDSEVQLRLVTRARMGLRISGTVVDDQGKPLAHVPVQTSRRDAQTLSDQNGHFELENLPQGQAELQARLPNGARSPSLKVTAGSTGVELVVPRLATLKGNVVGASGPCSIALGSGGALHASTHEVDGVREFIFAEITPGTHVLEAQCEEGAVRTTVEIGPGEERSIQMKAGASGLIRGVVRRFPKGEALAGVRCSVGMASDTSDAQGDFEVGPLPPGVVRVDCVRVGSLGFAMGRASVTVAPGQTAGVEVFAVEANGPSRGSATASESHIGASLEPVDKEHMDQFFFTAVVADGPADHAGIKDGDLLVSVAGVSARGSAALAASVYLLSHEPGTRVELVAERDGEELSFELQLPPAP